MKKQKRHERQRPTWKAKKSNEARKAELRRRHSPLWLGMAVDLQFDRLARGD